MRTGALIASVMVVGAFAGIATAGRSSSTDGGPLETARSERGTPSAATSGNDDAPWVFYTDGLGSFDIDGDEAHVTLIDPGTNAQIYRKGLMLDGDTEYRLTFDARTGRGQNVRVAVRKHGPPYTSYGLARTVDLTGMDAHYELTFTTTPGDKSDARLQLYFTPFDRPGDWYVFEDVSLERVDGEDDDDEEGAEFSEANLLFELNDTDGDLGFHGSIDGGPWTELVIETPDGAENIEIELGSSAAQQGLTQLFFESAEPNFDDLDPEEFFARFPEGVYEISGVSIDGEELENTDEVVHLLPAPAANAAVNGQPLPEDCDEGPVPVVTGPLVITWDPVTHSHPELGRTNEPITVVSYEVVVEREEPELKLSFLVPSDVNKIVVPASLIGDGGEIKVEILTREESGNQTAVESCVEAD